MVQSLSVREVVRLALARGRGADGKEELYRGQHFPVASLEIETQRPQQLRVHIDARMGHVPLLVDGGDSPDRCDVAQQSVNQTAHGPADVQ